MNNACATQAIISCLLNLDKGKHEGVELGETLDGFKVLFVLLQTDVPQRKMKILLIGFFPFQSFTQSFDPGMKGLSLGSSYEIRTVHNSFARQSVFELDQKVAEKVSSYCTTKLEATRSG